MNGYLEELYRMINTLKAEEIEYGKILLSKSINDYHLHRIRAESYEKVIDDIKEGIILLVIGMLHDKYPDVNDIGN